MDDELEARGAACTQPTRRSQTQHGCSEVLPTQGFSRLAGELTRPVCVSRRDGGDHDWLGKCWVYNQRLALYFLKDKERQKLLKENASADKDDPESAWLLSSDDEKDKPKKTDKSDSKGDNKNDKVVAVEVLLLSPKAGNELGFVCVQRKDTVEQMRTQLSLMLARARSLPGIKKNPMLWHRFELFSCREPHGFAFPVSDAHADAPAHLFFSAGQLALLRPLEEAAEVDTEVTAETATDADSNLDTETHGETTHSTAKTAARKAKKSKEKEVLPRSPSRAESGSVDLLSSA